MTDAAADLSGQWHGIFNYPGGAPPNAFEAELREAGGIITGETRERSDDPRDTGHEQSAFIEGRRSGHAVDFVKRYDAMHRDHVVYTGSISDDGTEIAGRWTIAGAWSGSFLMVRPARQEAEVTRKAAAPVE